jgi:hypothetical protein
LKTIPTLLKTFRSRPPQAGHSVRDGSLKLCTASSGSPQSVQRY